MVFQISQIGDDDGAKDFLKELGSVAKSVKSLHCNLGGSTAAVPW